MKLLGSYTLSGSTTDVTLSGLDTAYDYENLTVFFRTKNSHSSANYLYVCPNHNGSTTWFSGGKAGFGTSSTTTYQYYGETNGCYLNYGTAGGNEFSPTMGIIEITNRAPDSRCKLQGRYGISGFNSNNTHMMNAWFSGTTNASTNGSLITSLRFLTFSNFTIAEFHVYGS